MLGKISENAAEAYRRAEACARKAEAATDPKVRLDFLEMERRWLILARSYEFVDRLDQFANPKTPS